MAKYRQTQNPFRPGTASRPPYFAGRDDVIRTAERTLASHGNNFGSFTVLSGPRGTGKTSTIAEIAATATEREWAIVRIEVRQDGALLRHLLGQLVDLNGLPKKLSAKVGRVMRTWGEQEQEIDLKVYRRTARRPALDLPISDDVIDVVLDVVRHRTDRASGLLIAIDEAQLAEPAELYPIGPAVQRVSEDASMTASVMLAGLSSLPSHLGRAFTYSERWEFFDLVNLTEDEAAAALSVPARDTDKPFNEAALTAAVEWSRGYPFAVQLIGMHAWNEASTTIDRDAVTTAIRLAGRSLTQGLYARRWQSATPAERAYLAAAAQSPTRPIATRDIAAALGKRITSVSDVRARLIDSGELVAAGQGWIDEAIPGFLHYVRDETYAP